MNNEHDELLSDLIKYYGTDNNPNSGDTTVLDINKSVPPMDETFGDTVVVNVKRKPQTVFEEKTSAPNETTVIDIPAPEPREIPVDEVFGNLDLAGRVIETPPEPAQPSPRRVMDVPNVQNFHNDTAPARRKRSLWYVMKPLWATIIVCAMLAGSYLFYVTDTGIIGIYKRNFSYNFSLILRTFGIEYDGSDKLPIVGNNNPFVITAYAEDDGESYKTIDEKKATIPFEGADGAKFEKYDKGVVCAKSNYICYITKSGKKKWEHDTTISDPLISAAGKYVAVAAKNSTQLSLYKNGKRVFLIDAPNNIKSCSVSEKGDIALVIEKTSYKGAISVINNKGEEVFSWISGVNYITSATMLKNRNVSVSLTSTENSIKSYVMIFDIYSTDPLGGTEIPDALVFDSTSYKKNTYACADNSISSINADGELNYTVRFDNMDITHTSSDKKGWRLVSYTDNHLPCINVYKPNGDLYASASVENTPEHTDVYKSVILYNNGRDVICGKINRTKTKYSAPMAVKNLVMITKNTYMIAYENSLEIIKI